MPKILGDLPKNFKLMVLNTSISRFGDSYFGIVITWITLLITSSSFYLGIVSSMGLIAYFLSIVVSAIVDKTRKKKVTAYTANIFKMMIPSLVILSIYANNTIIDVFLLALATFLSSIASDFLSAIRASWVKIFLTSESMYKKGVSLVIYSQTIFQAIGYGLSSFLLTYSPVFPNLLLVIIFGLGLIPLILIKYDESSIFIKEQSLTSAIIETMRFIISERTLFQVLSFILIYDVIFEMAPVLYATLVYFKGLSSVYLGSFFISQILGLATGGFVLGMIKGKVGRISLFSMIGIGISFLTLPIMPLFILSYISSFFAGFFFGFLSSITLTLITKLSPTEMLARVQGFMSSFILAIGFVGRLAAGIISGSFGADTSFMILGTMFFAFSPLALLFKGMGKQEI